MKTQWFALTLTLTLLPLDLAYAEAMREVMKQNPDDLDAATLFAEAALAWQYADLKTPFPISHWTSRRAAPRARSRVRAGKRRAGAGKKEKRFGIPGTLSCAARGGAVNWPNELFPVGR